VVTVVDCLKSAYILGIASISIPLLLIFTATVVSGWFNLYYNALSDLGHAVKSNVAWIFNLGLAIGGVLIIITSDRFILSADLAMSVLVSLIGFSLILIGVFDEVYGRLHFYVSFMFFSLLLLMALIYPLRARRKLMPIGVLIVVVNVFTWYMHFTHNNPPGAAIPELVSIFSVVAFYLDAVRYYSSITCRRTMCRDDSVLHSI
jgi:hypothetical membrane protein